MYKKWKPTDLVGFYRKTVLLPSADFTLKDADALIKICCVKKEKFTFVSGMKIPIDYLSFSKDLIFYIKQYYLNIIYKNMKKKILECFKII